MILVFPKLKHMRILAILITILSFPVLNAQNLKSIHLLNYNSNEDLIALADKLEGLSKKGINQIFLEVDYHFDFKSHPELQQTENVITKKGAAKFAKIANSYGIKIVPQFQSLGHQSWAENTWKLLTVYPELDLTPGAFPDNDSIYCREWDVMNPRVNEIVFPMIDEIIDAFNADGIHLGMDEVFLLGHPKSPSTKGMDPAFLFGKVVREFHDYFTEKHGKQLYMWGDRLIDMMKYGYGTWEASANGTWKAIDSIPKDIIICDWHYLVQNEYPSVDLFLEKGFRVLPSSWKDVDAAKAFIGYSFAKQNPKMLGHMFTTWGAVPKEDLLDFGSMNEGLVKIEQGRFHKAFIKGAGVNEKGQLLVSLSTSNPDLKIAYSLDGSDPRPDSSLYDQPFVYPKDAVVKAVPVQKGAYAGEITEAEFVVHKAIGKKIIKITEPSDKYTSELREKALVNGVAFTASYGDGEWLGYEGNDAEFIVDFEEQTSVSEISLNFNNKVNDWVHHSNHVIILGSKDGEVFNVIEEKKLHKTGRPIVNVTIKLTGEFSQIKVIAKNQIIPEGFNGAGNPAWLFIDEVEVK